MNIDRRAFLGLASTAVVTMLAGCASSVSSSSSSAASASSSSSSSSSNSSASSAQSTSAAATGATPPSQMSLSDLLVQAQPKFSEQSYIDASTGTTIKFNLCLPDGYDSSKTYPMMTFIGDASTVGKGTAYSLTQGYGGIVWASDYDQAIHPSFVLVPAYDSTIIDDNSGSTKTDLLDVTGRLIDSVASAYPVDRNRLYATGQSMGCMTMLYLAANKSDLFAAEMFVDGQWDVSELPGLPTQKFCYFAAGGDSKASTGQANVEQMMDTAGISYATATLDATWSSDQINSTAQAMLDEGRACNFPSWVSGTVVAANPGKNMEHMASFDPAYKVDAVRSWVYKQSR